jgi:hypothetical protein
MGRRLGQPALPTGDGAGGVAAALAAERGEILAQAHGLDTVDPGLRLQRHDGQQQK